MRQLQPILNPRSIAVAGASESQGYGGLVFNNIIRSGFQGKLFAVNPKYNRVFGHECFKSVQDIPDDVDCLVLAVAGRSVMPAIQQASERRVKAVLAFASGFAETGAEGRALQDDMRQFARDKGLLIHGPNCLGILNAKDHLALYGGPMPERWVPGKVGFVSQSGALTVCLTWALMERRIGFNYLLSTGNEVDLEAVDYIEYMLQDPDINVVACFIEGFKDGAKFKRAADLALQQGKPIVVLKVGRSERGSRAALAHTGALAGDDKVLDALFRQKGVIRVHDLDELIEAAELFSKATLPKGEGVAAITISGGEVSLLSDMALDLKLQLPDLSPNTKQKLSENLPPFITPANPLDTAGTGPGGGAITHGQGHKYYARCLDALAQDVNIDLVVIAQNAFNRQGSIGPSRTQLMVDVASATAEASKTTTKPLILLSSISGGFSDELYEVAKTAGFSILQGAREGLAAIKHLIEFSQLLARQKQAQPAAESETPGNRGTAPAWLHSPNKVLTAHESMTLLAEYGIPVARGRVACCAQQAVEIARELGYPVALKVESPQLAHKTEAGALKLGLATEGDVIQAYDQVLCNARTYAPQADIWGVLVQEMITSGTEVILGLASDSQFGPVILFGPGGIFVELFRDFSLRLPPLRRQDAEEMIGEIRAHKLLSGFRGKPKADVHALVEVLLKLSRLAGDLGGLISELDINPLIVFEEGRGATAVDALIVLK